MIGGVDTVLAFRSLDGELHVKPERFAASNLHHRLPKRFNDSNTKTLEFSQCLAAIEHRSLIEQCFRELDTAKSMNRDVVHDGDAYGGRFVDPLPATFKDIDA